MSRIHCMLQLLHAVLCNMILYASKVCALNIDPAGDVMDVAI